jgi:hypothetical protein
MESKPCLAPEDSRRQSSTSPSPGLTFVERSFSDEMAKGVESVLVAPVQVSLTSSLLLKKQNQSREDEKENQLKVRKSSHRKEIVCLKWDGFRVEQSGLRL